MGNTSGHGAGFGAARILVAEDDQATRLLLRATLERGGYVVQEATSGGDALHRLQSSAPPDLALLDIQMPAPDGLELTRQLRAAPETTTMPIILVTAMGRLEDKISGLDAGATDFITKPFQPPELLARVRAGLRLKGALDRLESAQDVLVSLANAIEAKDPLTEHHCQRVAERALALARAAGLDATLMEAVGYGAVLHDVGKIGIPEAILNKPGPLTDAEWAVMRRHPLIGAGIVRPLRLGRQLEPIVRGHHERWDGGGYPDGLRGEAIPIGARIVTIADAYDAMINDRPYRRGMGVEQAREELLRCAGVQFDPELATLFSALVEAGETAPPIPTADDADYMRGLHRWP